MERIAAGDNYPPVTGKLRPDQIADRKTWAAVPDSQAAQAAMHVIRVRPVGSTTVTNVNPVDPATVGRDPADTTTHDGYLGYLESPAADAPVIPSRFPR